MPNIKEEKRKERTERKGERQRGGAMMKSEGEDHFKHVNESKKEAKRAMERERGWERVKEKGIGERKRKKGISSPT